MEASHPLALSLVPIFPLSLSLLPFFMDLRPPPHPSPHHKRSSSAFILPTVSLAFQREASLALGSLVLFLSFVLFLEAATPFRPLSLFRQAAFPLIPHRSAAACDYSAGRWVRDDDDAGRFYTEDCPFLDPGFQCRRNGRNDTDYLNWRWRPHGCDLPRFDATKMLESSRNKKIVFVGDSIGRNQWESLVCMLAAKVENKSSIYEKNGNPITKHKGFLAIWFDNYNLTVEYHRAPFLVVIGRPPPNSPPHVQKAILLDTMSWHWKQWLGADVLIFTDGHWWNDIKTTKVGNYFQEGATLNMSMDVKQAFQRSLETWRHWVLDNVPLDKTHVFFSSYTPIHYSNGSWDTGGNCHSKTRPEAGPDAFEAERWNNEAISRAVGRLQASDRMVDYLNITYLSEFRRDGHPSSHLEPGIPPGAPQDCSHWCLPGVPDTWNEVLYAHLLSRGYDTKRRSA